MIQLPEKYLDEAFVDNIKGVIYLHFRNSANQYFTYRYFLDKAYTFDQHITRLEGLDLTESKAYVLKPDLTTEWLEASDQDWVPAPLPGDNMISFLQYKAHARLASQEDRKAKMEGNTSDSN